MLLRDLSFLQCSLAVMPSAPFSARGFCLSSAVLSVLGDRLRRAAKPDAIRDTKFSPGGRKFESCEIRPFCCSSFAR